MRTRHRAFGAALIAIGLTTASPIWAQRGPGEGQQGEPGQAGPQQGRGEQRLDRDRDQDRAAAQDRDRDQTRDQLHVQDAAQIRDQDI